MRKHENTSFSSVEGDDDGPMGKDRADDLAVVEYS